MREVNIGGATVTLRPLKRGEVREAGLEKLGVGPLALMPKAEVLNELVDILLTVFEVPAAASDKWEPKDFSDFWDHFRAEQYRMGRFAEAEEKNSERSGDGTTTRTE